MIKCKNPILTFEKNQYELSKSDLRVARLFGFTFGFITALVLMLITLYCNGKL
jgi:tetrahydromethanopterin S-methyltransferase subunit F